MIIFNKIKFNKIIKIKITINVNKNIKYNILFFKINFFVQNNLMRKNIYKKKFKNKRIIKNEKNKIIFIFFFKIKLI